MQRTTPTGDVRRLHLVPRLAADDAVEESLGGPQTVVADVAAALAGASDEILAMAPFALPLALSVCMERHGVAAESLVETMKTLRTAVLTVTGMDRQVEPFPLGAGDPKVAALALADYLVGLLRRAVEISGTSPEAVATAAAALLAA